MSKARRGAVVATLAFALVGCVSETVRTVDMTPPKQATTTVPEELLLDVGEQKHIIAHVPKGIVLASDFKEGKQVYVGITAFQVFPLN